VLGAVTGAATPSEGSVGPPSPMALLGGPLRKLLLGERPTVDPLLPIVLPFIELPVVVELAASPPAAELPPAVAPADDPELCANADPSASDKAVAMTNINFLIETPFPLVTDQPNPCDAVPKDSLVRAR
jgi:hypothetical protein